MREAARGKRLVAVFLLGLALLNFPMLAVVDAGDRLFGLPVLFAYLFGVWALLIGCLALIVEGRRREARDPGRRDRA
jgi:peptidoglycan/LPS O-acetylase OafA/YrhL